MGASEGWERRVQKRARTCRGTRGSRCVARMARRDCSVWSGLNSCWFAAFPGFGNLTASRFGCQEFILTRLQARGTVCTPVTRSAPAPCRGWSCCVLPDTGRPPSLPALVLEEEKTTRVWGRPGENLKTWSSSIFEDHFLATGVQAAVQGHQEGARSRKTGVPPGAPEGGEAELQSDLSLCSLVAQKRWVHPDRAFSREAGRTVWLEYFREEDIEQTLI